MGDLPKRQERVHKPHCWADFPGAATPIVIRMTTGFSFHWTTLVVQHFGLSPTVEVFSIYFQYFFVMRPMSFGSA